jgi:hypothetical protein
VFGALAVVVIAIVLIGRVAFVSTVKAATVKVSAVNFSSGDYACGTDGDSGPGFATTPNATIQEAFSFTDPLLDPCTIGSVSVTTPGFNLTGADTPSTIPADTVDSLTFVLHVPSQGCDGAVVIDIGRGAGA